MINLIVALRCEARPLIEFFKLKQTESEPHPIYEGKNIRLILSGISQLNSACAVTTLKHSKSVLENEVWINIGMAGHPHLPIGTGCLVSSISNKQNNRVFYPHLVFKTQLTRVPLVSIERPSIDYLPNTLFDMEAYGFYFAAIKYGLSEQIQVYKVVSDNKNTSLDQISPKWVERLMEKKLDEIKDLIESLLELTTPFQSHPQLPLFLEHWSYSETQKYNLTRMLNILIHHEPEQDHFHESQKIEKTKDLLQSLSKKLQKVVL